MAESILEATPGADDANSYVDAEEADAYFATRLNVDAWDDAETDEKEKALIMAARMIDRLTFKYVRANALIENGVAVIQALAFPRIGSKQNESHILYDDEGEVIIPQPIKDAQCEQALFILQNPSSGDLYTLRQQGIASQSIGDASITFDRGAAQAATPQAANLCIEAQAILQTWRETIVRVGRG